MVSSRGICESEDDLSVGLLRTALNASAISFFTTTRIEGAKVGSVFRVHLEYDPTAEEPGPATVILKTAGKDHVSNGEGSVYEREIRFYQEIASPLRTSSTDSLAQCYHAAFDSASDKFTLLLEDAGETADTGDDLEGATSAQALLALSELGRIHAPFLRKGIETAAMQEQARTWLQQPNPLNAELLTQLFAAFRQRYEDQILPDYLDVCSKLVASYDQYCARCNELCVQGLLHGDYRMENLLFVTRTVEEGRSQSTTEAALMIVDWQTVTWGPLLSDVAYFLGCALEVHDRRQWEEELLQSYCDAIGEQEGDPLMTLEICKDNLRWQSFTGVIMIITSSMLVADSDQADPSFLTMLARHCQLVIDLGAMQLLGEADLDVS